MRAGICAEVFVTVKRWPFPGECILLHRIQRRRASPRLPAIHRMMKAPLSLLAAGLVSTGSFFTGCVVPSDRGLNANDPAYSDPTRVQLLTAEPDRAYVVVGEVQLDDGQWRNEQVAETAIRTEGARLLADAVIVYGGRGNPRRPLAIRYTEPTPALGTTVVSAAGAAGTASGATTGTGGASGGSGGGGGGGAFPDTSY